MKYLYVIFSSDVSHSYFYDACIILQLFTHNKFAQSQAGVEVFSLQNILKLIRIIIVTASIVYIPMIMTGCSGNKGQQQNAELQAIREKQSSEKESEKLKKTEAQIEMLFETLGGPSVKIRESGQDNKDSQQEGHENDAKQQDTQQDEGQKDKPKQDSGQKDDQQQGTKPDDSEKENKQQGGKETAQKESDKWPQVSSIITKLHYQWNDLMPEIAKKGANMKLVDNFDNALNSLTETIDSKDKKKVLASANKLYSYIPDLYSLYRVKMSPEVKRMIYYTRNIILESDKEGWVQVAKDNEALEKSWSLLRNTLEKEQKKIEDKLDFSIYDLKKVVEEKNSQITGIKGKIVLNNITELQKSFEEREKRKNQHSAGYNELLFL